MHTHTCASFLSVCSLEESSTIHQDQTLTGRGIEGGAAEINCNGVIEIINFTENSNKETLRLKEDLHNANDCDIQNLKQEPSLLSSQNGDSSTSQETDSCTPVTSEVSNTMMCQSSSNVDQSFSEHHTIHHTYIHRHTPTHHLPYTPQSHTTHHSPHTHTPYHT